MASELSSLGSDLRVLAVDDDLDSLIALKKMLLQCSYQVTTCQRAEDALSLLQENNSLFDILLTEIQMPEMSGFQLLAETSKLPINLPVILFSADLDQDMAKEGLYSGASHVLRKPISIDILKVIWQLAYCHPNTIGLGRGGSVAKGVPIKGYDNLSCSSQEESYQNNSNITVAAMKKKKPRFSWTEERHNLFVEAVKVLGVDNSVPKKILEYMQKRCKDPNLSRHVISSHLQQFRGTKLYAKSEDHSSVNIQSLYSMPHPSVDPIWCSTSDIPPEGYYTYGEHWSFNADYPSSIFSLPSYPSQEQDPLEFDYSSWTMPLQEHGFN